MQNGDIKTITLKKTPAGSFQKILEKEWLLYMGYNETDLDKDELVIVFKAEISDHKKIPYIGIGKPLNKY